MLQCEVLVLELVTVDGFSSGSVAPGEVSALLRAQETAC